MRRAHNNEIFVYYVASGAIKGKVLAADGSVTVTEFTAVASGVDDAQIGADVYFNQQGGMRVALWYVASGSVTSVESVNGVAFA